MQVTTIGSIVSIAFFNFFGLSVTKSLSGAARATIDASRTLLIWLFSIQIGWERFHFLQVQSPLHAQSLLHAMPAAGIHGNPAAASAALPASHCCLQVLGFLVLVSGTSLYNELIRGCLPSSSSLPDPEEDALQVTTQIQTRLRRDCSHDAALHDTC